MTASSDAPDLARIAPRSVLLRDGRGVCVRVANPGDAAGIVRARMATAREVVYTIAEPDEVNVDEEREAKLIRAAMSHPGSLRLVADTGDAIVGYLEFSNGSRRRIRHSGSFAIYLIDGWRDQGLGRAMIEMLLDWATASPIIEKVRLSVFSTNVRAIALYESCGFQVEGNSPHYMKLSDGTYLDCVEMYRFVDGVTDGRRQSTTNLE